MIDSADHDRFDETGHQLSELLDEPKLKGVPVLIFANKMDLQLAKHQDDVSWFTVQFASVDLSVSLSLQISAGLLLHAIRHRDWHIQPCCAIKNEGVQVHTPSHYHTPHPHAITHTLTLRISLSHPHTITPSPSSHYHTLPIHTLSHPPHPPTVTGRPGLDE